MKRPDSEAAGLWCELQHSCLDLPAGMLLCLPACSSCALCQSLTAAIQFLGGCVWSPDLVDHLAGLKFLQASLCGPARIFALPSGVPDSSKSMGLLHQVLACCRAAGNAFGI